MALSETDRFNLEVLKLLMNVAWVDGSVDQREVNMLIGLGRSWTVPEAALQKIIEAVHAGKKPGEPDYELLKSRADDALMAARALVLTDNKVHVAESELLKKIASKLPES